MIPILAQLLHYLGIGPTDPVPVQWSRAYYCDGRDWAPFEVVAAMRRETVTIYQAERR